LSSHRHAVLFVKLIKSPVALEIVQQVAQSEHICQPAPE
jgi:hypothetical protein